jgi:hypothetical protein
MQQLQLFLEQTDLRLVHVVLCLGGVLLSTHLMQLLWHNPEEGGMFLKLVRRVNLALVALSMLWSLGIADQRGWQPWPAFVLLLFSVDLMMLIRVFVIYRMQRRGARITPPYHREGVAHIRRVS